MIATTRKPRGIAFSELEEKTPPDWRWSVNYQYFDDRVPHHGAVTGLSRLVRFEGPDLDAWELFDVRDDPHELRTVYGDPPLPPSWPS